MARDLDIKIVVDNTQAKRNLQQVDSAIKQTGTSAIQADAATSQLQATMSKLGTVIGVTSGAALAGIVVNLTKAILADADALVKLSDKTGIGVEALQRFNAVGEDSGNTIEQITMAISMMQRQLAGGDKGAVAALQTLNLTWEELRRLSPDQQFIEIAKAIAKVEDPAERTRLAVELFGRSGAEILPTIRADIEGITKSTYVMSRTSVEAWDTIGDAIGRVSRTIKAFAGELIARVIIPFHEAVQDAAILKDISNQVAKNAPGGSTASPLSVPGLPDDLDAITKSLDEQHKAILAVNAAAQKLADEGAKAAAKAIDDFRNSVHNLQINTQELVIAGLPMVGLINDIGEAASEHMRDLQPLDATLNDLGTQTLPNVTSSLTKASGGFKDFFSNIFEGFKSKLDFGSILNNMIGGGLSSLLSTGIGLVTKGIGSLFSKIFGGDKELKQVKDMRTQFIQMSGGLTELQRQANLAGVSLDAMLNARKVDQFNAAVKNLNQSFDDFNADQARAKELIDEYHISIEQLGPAFRNQQLNEQAKGLMNDFRLMVDVLGVSAPDAMLLMKDKMNDFVQTAIKTGFEVPAAMRKLIEQMIANGQLIDENGVAYKDLSETGITFAETMTDAVDRMTKTFQTLIDRLFGVADAVNGIPDHKDVTITYHEEGKTQTDFASSGGLVTAHGIQHLASGGTVLPWRPRGTDVVPAMLTPGELVLSRKNAREYLNGRNSGAAQSGPVNVTVHANGYVDSPAAQRNLARIVSDELMRTIARRTRAS